MRLIRASYIVLIWAPIMGILTAVQLSRGFYSLEVLLFLMLPVFGDRLASVRINQSREEQ